MSGGDVVQRVRKTALSLARSLLAKRPDLLVVEMAALLHDILDKKYVAAADPHAYFLPFFEILAREHQLDLISDGRACLIVRVIQNVSWTTEKKLRETGGIEEWHENCVELHCVQDADRLDAIGAFGDTQVSISERCARAHLSYGPGIMRCAAYSAVTNRQVSTTVVQCYANGLADLYMRHHQRSMIQLFNIFTKNFCIYMID